MELKPGDDMAHFKYEAKEYFVSGTANGQPYKTRIVIRKPADNGKFSGLVLAESMHPSGNAWMFHFTHRYSMTSGHIGLDILTSTHVPFVEFNPERYKDLQVGAGQASEILAQVGALMKSKQRNPLAGLPMRKMILAGHVRVRRRAGQLPAGTHGAAPAGHETDLRRLPADQQRRDHPADRRADDPGADDDRGDGRHATARQDGDEPGNQFRVYEFAGMAHIDSRDAAAYYPNPCRLPISRFPMAAYMSVALHHLWQWVDKGTVPPRADRILVDRNEANDGSLMALDELRQRQGRHPQPVRRRSGEEDTACATRARCRRSPTRTRSSRHAAKRRRISCAAWRATSMHADAGAAEEAVQGQEGLPGQGREALRRADEAGWALPVYREVVLADAAAVSF